MASRATRTRPSASTKNSLAIEEEKVCIQIREHLENVAFVKTRSRSICTSACGNAVYSAAKNCWKIQHVPSVHNNNKGKPTAVAELHYGDGDGRKQHNNYHRSRPVPPVELLESLLMSQELKSWVELSMQTVKGTPEEGESVDKEVAKIENLCFKDQTGEDINFAVFVSMLHRVEDGPALLRRVLGQDDEPDLWKLKQYRGWTVRPCSPPIATGTSTLEVTGATTSSMSPSRFVSSILETVGTLIQPKKRGAAAVAGDSIEATPRPKRPKLEQQNCDTLFSLPPPVISDVARSPSEGDTKKHDAESTTNSGASPTGRPPALESSSESDHTTDDEGHGKQLLKLSPMSSSLETTTGTVKEGEPAQMECSASVVTDASTSVLLECRPSCDQNAKSAEEQVELSECNSSVVTDGSTEAKTLETELEKGASSCQGQHEGKSDQQEPHSAATQKDNALWSLPPPESASCVEHPEGAKEESHSSDSLGIKPEPLSSSLTSQDESPRLQPTEGSDATELINAMEVTTATNAGVSAASSLAQQSEGSDAKEITTAANAIVSTVSSLPRPTKGSDAKEATTAITAGVPTASSPPASGGGDSTEATSTTNAGVSPASSLPQPSEGRDARKATNVTNAWVSSAASLRLPSEGSDARKASTATKPSVSSAASLPQPSEASDATKETSATKPAGSCASSLPAASIQDDSTCPGKDHPTVRETPSQRPGEEKGKPQPPTQLPVVAASPLFSLKRHKAKEDGQSTMKQGASIESSAVPEAAQEDGHSAVKQEASIEPSAVPEAAQEEGHSAVKQGASIEPSALPVPEAAQADGQSAMKHGASIEPSATPEVAQEDRHSAMKQGAGRETSAMQEVVQGVAHAQQEISPRAQKMMSPSTESAVPADSSVMPASSVASTKSTVPAESSGMPASSCETQSSKVPPQKTVPPAAPQKTVPLAPPQKTVSPAPPQKTVQPTPSSSSKETSTLRRSKRPHRTKVDVDFVDHPTRARSDKQENGQTRQRKPRVTFAEGDNEFFPDENETGRPSRTETRLHHGGDKIEALQQDDTSRRHTRSRRNKILSQNGDETSSKDDKDSSQSTRRPRRTPKAVERYTDVRSEKLEELAAMKEREKLEDASSHDAKEEASPSKVARSRRARAPVERYTDTTSVGDSPPTCLVRVTVVGEELTDPLEALLTSEGIPATRRSDLNQPASHATNKYSFRTRRARSYYEDESDRFLDEHDHEAAEETEDIDDDDAPILVHTPFIMNRKNVLKVENLVDEYEEGVYKRHGTCFSLKNGKPINASTSVDALQKELDVLDRKHPMDEEAEDEDIIAEQQLYNKALRVMQGRRSQEHGLRMREKDQAEQLANMMLSKEWTSKRKAPTVEEREWEEIVDRPILNSEARTVRGKRIAGRENCPCRTTATRQRDESPPLCRLCDDLSNTLTTPGEPVPSKGMVPLFRTIDVDAPEFLERDNYPDDNLGSQAQETESKIDLEQKAARVSKRMKFDPRRRRETAKKLAELGHSMDFIEQYNYGLLPNLPFSASS